MPLLNPFRRQQPDRSSLRQNAASVAARLARVVRKPATPPPTSETDETPATLEEAAQLGFTAYDLPDPIKTPPQWVERFADFAIGMHIADRILRMSKTEAMAFIRDAGERDADLAANMFQVLNSAQTTFEGWGKLLDVASSRYLVAGSAIVLADQAPDGQEEEAPEPATSPVATQPSAEADAMLLALASDWEAARDAYDEASNRQSEITAAANADNPPGPAPENSGPKWQAWFQRSKEWRERTGIDAAEEASAAACRVVGEVEDRIAALPAGSLAGLRLKARVAQHNQDIGVDWPEGLGEGLAQDILAFSKPSEAQPQPVALKFDRSISDRIDFADATLEELVAVHDTAKLVGDVAQAVVWQGRCEVPANQRRPGKSYNAAGELMTWLSDELTHVEHLAFEEMKKRRPAQYTDREMRLAWIASTIVQNGDLTETATFIGELAALLADGAEG